MARQEPTRATRRRPTEPPPKSFRPAWLLVLALTVVVGLIALASYLVDRAIYG